MNDTIRTPYDGENKTALFLKYAEGCHTVFDLFEKIKLITDTTLQGDITEGLVKVMLDCKKVFELKNVRYTSKNKEGIDLYAESKRTNKTIPIQVKFRSSEILSNDDLNSFGKMNWLEGHETGYVIGNLKHIPADWRNSKVSCVLKNDFDNINLNELVSFACKEIEYSGPNPMTPRGYQPIWLENLQKNANLHKRGKLLAPPGFGKTIGMASYIRYLKKNKIGYVGAPFIRLVNQNMMNIVDELSAYGYDVHSIVVNSGSSIKKQGQINIDDMDETEDHNIIHPTTNPDEIRKFVRASKKDKNAKSIYIIFACYGSTETVLNGCKGYAINYGLFDEAQNVVGHVSRRNTQYLFNKYIKMDYRCFVTATQKVYNGERDEIVAMNNEKLFGKELAFASFKDAIEYGNIKDYRVVVPSLTGKELDAWWLMLKQNLYVCDGGTPVTMAQVCLKVLIYKMISKYPITRMVAGFNLIDNAKNMAGFLSTEDAITKHFGFVVKSTWVSSKETQSTNNDRIRQFANSTEKYVLCAPPMLKEGVDIKGIDVNGNAMYPNSVVFCDNKRGQIGIVQLAGRGFRMGNNKNELCYIGLPVIYHPEQGQEEIYNEAFERTKEVIVSLGANDERLAQELTTIRIGKAAPKKYKISTKIIEMDVPEAEAVDFGEFIDKVSLECVRSLNYTVDKASYEEHVKECKKYENGKKYNEAQKSVNFYSEISGIQKNWPKKDLFRDVGWKNIAHGEKANYEEHVDFIKSKKYKSAVEYNDDNAKSDFYYGSVRKIVDVWPNEDIYKDVNWYYDKEKKASYSDHVSLGKKYKNCIEYMAAKKPNRYYSAVESIRRKWKNKNFAFDCGWETAIIKKASYKEHVSLGRKYSSQCAFARAKKDIKFYSDGKIVQKKYPSKNFYKDCGWRQIKK
jgi:superfamily II DNA or RNA helicase